MSSSINRYGDHLVQAGLGHGADIASQRADDLDMQAIERARALGAARVLDLGAGRGAQAARLLEAGASLAVAADREDFSLEYASLARPFAGKAIFCNIDLLTPNFSHNIINCCGACSFDIIVFQRTVHYFRFAKAGEVMKEIISLMAPGGRLYVSASGLLSELGDGYADKGLPIEERFAKIDEAMAIKHGIHAPVCLYRSDDLRMLCEAAGLRVLGAQESSFGNIKAAAEKT